MSYNLEEFVGANQHNIVYQKHPTSTDINPALVYKFNFENTIEFDVCNAQYTPIFVYERAGEPIAWFNANDLTGFIKV